MISVSGPGVTGQIDLGVVQLARRVGQVGDDLDGGRLGVGRTGKQGGKQESSRSGKGEAKHVHANSLHRAVRNDRNDRSPVRLAHFSGLPINPHVFLMNLVPKSSIKPKGLCDCVSTESFEHSSICRGLFPDSHRCTLMSRARFCTQFLSHQRLAADLGSLDQASTRKFLLKPALIWVNMFFN